MFASLESKLGIKLGGKQVMFIAAVIDRYLRSRAAKPEPCAEFQETFG